MSDTAITLWMIFGFITVVPLLAALVAWILDR